MSKPITVSSCAYVHETDIDPERHVDAKPIHAALDICIARAVRVLEQPLSLYGQLQRGTIASIFESMKATHAAIRTVLKGGADNPQIYREINELKMFPNFKGARYLAYCLNVMGLVLNQQHAHRDSFPLQRAVLRWTKKNYALLRQRNPEVADNCLVAGVSFDPGHMRIVKCYLSGFA